LLLEWKGLLSRGSLCMARQQNGQKNENQ